MKKKILVIGSSNKDYVVKVKEFPKPGQTIFGRDFFVNQGGKGANQAVTVSRLGGNVDFVCKTGKDSIGDDMISLFRDEGFDTSLILRDSELPSGTAFIMTDVNGENSIVVTPGANGNFTCEDVNKSLEAIERADIILLQLEIPTETISHIINLAHEQKKMIILNPAPMVPLSDDIISKVNVITPNKIECELLSGVQITDDESLIEAAKVIRGKGVDNVIVTLGSEGALIFNGTFKKVPALEVSPVDTTGAGDVFNGSLAVAIAEGQDIVSSVQFANEVSAYSIKREGAIQSIPYREEIQ